MKRTLRRLSLPAAFALLFAGGLLAARQDGDEFSPHHVAGLVHWISGPGGNIGVSAGEDGVLVVDSKFSHTFPDVQRALVEISDSPPRYLVNTHWHGDHSGGNAEFGATAIVIAHENVRRRLSGDPTLEGRVAEEPFPERFPTLTYDGGVSVWFNHEEIRCLHYPAGHTDGDTVVWFVGSKVLHMGDLFFAVGYPYIDVSSGGSPQGMLAAVEDVLGWIPEDAKIIPGHGDPTDVAGLREYRDMLRTSIERVKKALAEGKTPAQMHAEGLIDDLNPRWGHFEFVPPQGFLQVLAEGLSRR